MGSSIRCPLFILALDKIGGYEMYERMLDKHCKPSVEEFVEYCGNCKKLFIKADTFLVEELKTEKLMRFPYGNSYGWGMKYFIKSKHICDIFAEKDAFTLMMRLTNIQFEIIYNELSSYTKEFIDKKYPCGEGGWIHYRVQTEQHLKDIKKLLRIKSKSKSFV